MGKGFEFGAVRLHEGVGGGRNRLTVVGGWDLLGCRFD